MQTTGPPSFDLEKRLKTFPPETQRQIEKLSEQLDEVLRDQERANKPFAKN